MAIATDPVIRGLARDESLTRGLGDEEARMLVEWVVDWAELLIEAARSDTDAERLVNRLFRRARAIGRFVKLYCEPHSRGSAVQLAAVERFQWPIPPNRNIEPADLMQHILAWESDHRSG